MYVPCVPRGDQVEALILGARASDYAWFKNTFPVKRVRLLAVVALLAGGLMMAETVGASQSALRVIGGKSASGDFAIAFASGRAVKPTALYMRVLGRPNQGVNANWTMVCSKGTGAGSKSGRFSVTTPVTRRLRMPMTRPSDCVVSGGAQLRRSGRVTVLLLKQP
jgi:hypothetical protein